MRRSAGKHVVIGTMASIAVAACAQGASGDIPLGQRAAPAAVIGVQREGTKLPARLLPGIYYGTSRVPLANHAWLVRIGTRDAPGVLYARPGNLKLMFLSVDSTGHVKFRTDPASGGVVVSFTGTGTSPTVVGGMISLAGPRDRVAAPGYASRVQGPVELKRIALVADSASGSFRNGVYSNIEYNEESGDLTGVELVLIRLQSGPIVMFTSSSEGLDTRAGSDMAITGDSLRFMVRSSDGPIHFVARIAPDGSVTLRQTDSWADPRFATDTLHWKSTVAGALR